MAYRCRMGKDVVDFVYFDNQGDPLFSKACGITYKYSQCLKMGEAPPEAIDPKCAKNAWKTVKENTLFTSIAGRQTCAKKIEEKVAYLKSKGFSCNESAIN